jgi:hypothetical protein
MAQTIFPFVPEQTDWQSFNGNLIMYYGQEPLPISNELNWHDTARNLVQFPAFASYGIPNPDLFENWQDWAQQFVLLVNGQPNN